MKINMTQYMNTYFSVLIYIAIGNLVGSTFQKQYLNIETSLDRNLPIT